MSEVFVTPTPEAFSQDGPWAPQAAASASVAPSSPAAPTPAASGSHASPAARPTYAAHVPVLSVRQLEKVYGTRDAVTRALDGVSLEVDAGEFVGVMGPSGSGKTTLLNCIATIDRATGGRIVVEGRDVTAMSRRELARFRRDRLGFVFQDSNLLDTLTGYENIALALTIKGVAPKEVHERVEAIANSLGVAEVLRRYPYQMSGGQRQRVAAARAVVGEPALVLADEPTGALDSRAAALLLETLDSLNRLRDATIMMVTHDAFAASFAQRVVFIKDGRVFTELRRGDDEREAFFARIMEVVSFLGGDANHAA